MDLGNVDVALVDSELRIPYALNEYGDIIYPTEASRGTLYFCPECSGRLVFRAGQKVRHHFAHHHSPDDCRFINEGWLHVSAKYAIYARIQKWLAGLMQPPVIQRRCENKGCNYTQKIPLTVKQVRLEHRVNTPAGHYVADLALLDGESQPLCIVEILNTHAVDESKEEKMNDVPWVELDARAAVEHPERWIPLRYNNLKGTECSKCRNAKKDAKQMKVIHRGLALHVDYCPKRARRWRGKPYANVIDDCLGGCPYQVGADAGPTYNRSGITVAYGPTVIYCDYKDDLMKLK